jgi:hypothetical protein
MDLKFKKALEEAKKGATVALDLASDPVQTDISVTSRSAEDELERRRHKTQSRKIWGKFLLIMVVGGFTASYVIIVAIGLHWLNYTDSQFAVPSVIAAGVIGTYGLAKIAVNYFFTDD